MLLLFNCSEPNKPRDTSILLEGLTQLIGVLEVLCYYVCVCICVCISARVHVSVRVHVCVYVHACVSVSLAKCVIDRVTVPAEVHRYPYMCLNIFVDLFTFTPVLKIDDDLASLLE